MAYNVYSLPDVKSVLYHPDDGRCKGFEAAKNRAASAARKE